MPDSSVILPSLVVLTVLWGLHARIDVYGAFVRGAMEGLKTLIDMTPYLCAILTATALLRETGVLSVLEGVIAPMLERIKRGWGSLSLMQPIAELPFISSKMWSNLVLNGEFSIL